MNNSILATELSAGISYADLLPYSVGPLMYTPATREGLADKIESNAFGGITSLAICLEDAVGDGALSEAEHTLLNTLKEIRDKDLSYAPMLFVRVRTPQHLAKIHTMLGNFNNELTGYILPKFDMTNALEYKELFLKINEMRDTPLFFMPILESRSLAYNGSRIRELEKVKAVLDSVRPYILNVRVGGNDFCNLYGLRRSVNQTIYDIGVVRDILVDVINVFAQEYVVSGPVWEYFGTDPQGEWADGLKRELELDLLNGFIGKTVIHPTQIPIIREGLAVRRKDFEDACSILEWNNSALGVQSSSDKSRMNEVKCHGNWAKKTYILGKIYGIKD